MLRLWRPDLSNPVVIANTTPGDYFVFAKDFLVEVGDGSKAMLLEEPHVIGGLEAIQVDTYVFQKIPYDSTCTVRVYQRL